MLVQQDKNAKFRSNTTDGKTKAQTVTRYTSTTRTQTGGSETESDTEYVSVTETKKDVTGDSNVTIESQVPPPVQKLLKCQGSTSTYPTNGLGRSISMVTSRQKQLDSRTTITHTTITLSEPGSTNSNATVGAPIGTKCTIPMDVQPGRAPQMVVPNITAPVMSPLLLRINPLQIAVVAHLNRLVVCTPICEVETWKTEPHSAQYRLVMSATAPRHCTFVMPCSVAYVATTQHIINSPVITVAAFCLPVKQKTKKQEISRRTACAQLMLPPQGPLHAEKLRPLWETITFTIAYGKHVAIEYRMPKVSVIKLHYVKCNKHRAKEVDSRTLYKKVDEQTVQTLIASIPHQIILTTVEKSDPQMIRHVRLEQNPLFERMPSYCDVAEVDTHTTEQITQVSNNEEKNCTKRHTYIGHKLIQRWKNTIHIENRQQQID